MEGTQGIQDTHGSSRLLDRHWMKTANLKEVYALPAQRPGLQVRDDNGWTPLQYAAGVARVDVIGRLLDLGVNLGARTRRGGTALHVAAVSGHNNETSCLPVLLMSVSW